ncbi:MAG TPA: pyridoxal phosphate-dependent aminotransferase [Ktedonobacteraceae bacterium]|nr:pyridoxal phosphate-dependent aminotransferase [Ktedonobacteraceae bacterium]
MITRKDTVDIPASFSHIPLSKQEQRRLLRTFRQQMVARYRPVIMQGAGPIRVMARMVGELEQQCRDYYIDEEIMQTEIVNRTIGDVDLRRVSECEGKAGGPGDYRMLADELGVALPGEQLHGYTASGDTYLWLREQMMECERRLLQQHFDVRMYDIPGVGNPLLREWLVGDMQAWGLPVTKEQLYLALGAMDSADKVLRAMHQVLRERNVANPAVLFPAPGFNVPEWQARSYGYQLHHFRTTAEDAFKLTPAALAELLQQAPDISLIYLTITNNPTTFAYTADELNALYAVLRAYWEAGRDIYILADLAYIGTSEPAADMQRMATFATPDVLRHTIFINSFSKSYTLTGERFGYVTIGDAELAPALTTGWTNSTASLPGEWQLRYMAYYRLIQSRPWLIGKLRALYRLRRKRLAAQLRIINQEQGLFERIHLGDDATVYNWSQLRQGEDAFSLFEKTGIAGVPGSGFGYSDDYIRFSIGVIPVSHHL